MFRIVLCFSLALSLASGAAIPEGRIIGGLESGKGNFPYHVSIRDSFNHHLCSGAIIADDWVVTSANCIFVNRNEGAPRFVVAGALFRTRGGTPYDIEQIFTHPFFNWNTMARDIALIKTRTRFTTGPAVESVPVGTANLPGKVEVRSSGWGRTEIDGELSLKKLWFVQNTTDNEACAKALPANSVHMLSADNICAINENPGGKGNCFGDSGNPLVTGAASATLVGVASWGVPCAQEGIPDVYTRLSGYQDWINEITGAGAVKWV